VSKSAMTKLVRSHDGPGIAAALAESPELTSWRDERGRGWLHLCCMAKPSDSGADSIIAADVLLDAGFDIDEAAFTEGDWRATPLWHAVGRGRNLELAAHLLQRGADPNFCLWAAAFNDDLAAIDLLVEWGATVDDPAVPNESPFIAAISVSNFVAAERLLEHGADVDARDRAGRTALHLMVRKGSPIQAIEMVLRFDPRGDLADDTGATAIDLLRRKRAPVLRSIAERLAND
jgi:uncharacterized protein